MFKKFVSGTAAMAIATVPSAAIAASYGYNLHLVVPVYCSVNQTTGTGGQFNGDAYSLGTFREYCNAAQGYRLIVRYTPGTLRGAQIRAGEEVATLDGSGTNVVSRTTGPRVRQRSLFITPGEQGFDTDRLAVDILPV